MYSALSSELNIYQMRAITALTRPGLSGVFLVEGPPGTGKTTTIISTVQTLLSINAVYFCSSHHMLVYSYYDYRSIECRC